MRLNKLFIAIATGTLMLWGCDVKDSIYETDHPDEGQVTLIADWRDIGQEITKPSGYMAALGGKTYTATADRYTLTDLFSPDNYTIYVWNAADNVTVGSTTATANYAAGMPGWFFTGSENVTVKADTNHELTVNMEQRVRQLTLVIEATGGTADNIATITGTLSGVAGSYDMASGTHSAASSIALAFAKDADGKWRATVRILGVTGSEQQLAGIITFMGGTPGDMPLNSDLTMALAVFNDNKKEPLVLGSTLAETPTGAGFAATIKPWTIVTGSSMAD